MKKFLALVLGVIMVLSMTACSLFDSGNSEGEGNRSDLFEVKLTDTYVHEDPTDIEFEARYTLYSGSNPDLIAWYKEVDVDLLEEFIILYGDKDDVAVRQYTYLVFATEDDAAHYQETLKEYGQESTVEGTVLYYVYDQEKLQEDLDYYVALGVMEGTTASEYAKQNKEQFDELIDYIGE